MLRVDRRQLAVWSPTNGFAESPPDGEPRVTSGTRFQVLSYSWSLGESGLVLKPLEDSLSRLVKTDAAGGLALWRLSPDALGNFAC